MPLALQGAKNVFAAEQPTERQAGVAGKLVSDGSEVFASGHGANPWVSGLAYVYFIIDIAGRVSMVS